MIPHSKRNRLIRIAPFGIHIEISAPSFIIVCSEKTFSKNQSHIEASQLIYKPNQLTGFYMIPVFNEIYFQTDFHCFF